MLSEGARADVIGYIAKARDELGALLAEPAAPGAWQALTCPVLLLRGSASNPAATVTERLSGMIPGARLVTVRGAGHMGPMTHSEAVNHAIAEHVRRTEPAPSDARPCGGETDEPDADERASSAGALVGETQT